MYNGVLRLPAAKQAVVVGFADDVGVVITLNHPNEVQIYVIKSLLKDHGLELGEHKTELVLFTKRRRQKTVEIHIGAQVVSSR